MPSAHKQRSRLKCDAKHAFFGKNVFQEDGGTIHESSDRNFFFGASSVFCLAKRLAGTIGAGSDVDLPSPIVLWVSRNTDS